MTTKKRIPSKRLITAALGIALSATLASCKSTSAEPAPAEALAPTAQVRTEPVSELEVPRTLRLNGNLRGDREVDLAANASGRVLSVSFERGAEVKVGQVLATLDVRAAKLSAAEALAQLGSVQAQGELAKDECARYEQLKGKGAISDLEYQQRVAQCRTLPLSAEAASARAALMAQNVGDGVIRAPFAGSVAERFVEVGQFVRQDSKIAALVSLDPIRLAVAIPEAEVAQVQQGADVSFEVSAYPGRRFTGKIRYVSGVVRASTRDRVVEALVDNKDRALLPGMFADAELTVGTRVLPSVPRSAIVQRKEQAHLFVVEDGRLSERVVSLGPALGERVTVSFGVKLGQQVVVSDLAGISNGQRVQ